MSNTEIMRELFCTGCGRVVISTDSFKCCGEIENFDPIKHNRRLISNSNSWLRVYSLYKNDPLLKQIAFEFAENGCFSLSNVFIEFIERKSKNDIIR